MISGLLLHLGIYVFMMIYDFQILFIILYPLFLTNEQLINFFDKFKLFFNSLLSKYILRKNEL